MTSAKRDASTKKSPMAEFLDPKELTNLRELVMSLVWREEALVNLLEEKGILTRKGILERIKALREAQAKGSGFFLTSPGTQRARQR